eukprot:527316_1
MGNKHSKIKAQNKARNSNALEDGQLYQQLRNELNTGSKCVVFSKTFKKWICTNIEKIENKQGEEILTVKNGNYDTISVERFSNNIQPIFIC